MIRALIFDFNGVLADDDPIRLTIHGEFEEFVVLWIPAHPQRRRYGDPFGDTRKQFEEFLAILSADIRIELGSRQRIGQLAKRVLRYYGLCAIQEPANCTRGSRVRKQEPADQHIRIEDYSPVNHLRAATRPACAR